MLFMILFYNGRLHTIVTLRIFFCLQDHVMGVKPEVYLLLVSF